MKSDNTLLWRARLKNIGQYGLLVILVILAALVILDHRFPLNLPSPQDLFARVVLDKQGRPLRAFPDHRGVWRYAVSLEQVSPLYLEALLTYEDQRFWQHPGIDPIALVRAFVSNLRNGRVVSGGSTLSMQVARLLHPHSKTLLGKLYQMLRTLQLEWHLSKKDILTLYCNIAPFGGTIEGVQAASYTYLNKPVQDLTRAEAALLAVLPQSPTKFRPDLHPNAAQQARDKVLQRMVDLQVWTPQQAQQARIENVYAVRHIPEQHAPLLARRLVASIDHSQPLQRALRTTIDGDLQPALEDYVRYYIESQAEKTSAAVLVVDNHTSQVLSYIGTADFANRERFGHVDMVQAVRSPGSTLKPFLYALALDEGIIHSHSLLSDSPQNWNDYRPGNFSGGFSGPVSATSALQRSLNIPAVSLLDKFGPHNFSAQLKNAGVSLITPDNTANLTLILGGTGTSLENLVRGFSAFANGGLSQPLQFLLDQPTQEQGRFFFSPQAAWVVQHMLSGVSRPGSLRTVNAIAEQRKLAWKTGTSYGFRDSWAIGVDNDYTVGVWVGRPDGTPNPGASGRANAGPLLHAIVDHLPHARQPIQQPQGIDQVAICWPLGTAENEQPSAHCHQRHLAWIINNTIPPSWPDRMRPLQANPLTVLVDRKTKKRIHSGCTDTGVDQIDIALWPIELESWLPKKYRPIHQLPAFSTSCTHLTSSGNVFISGIADDTVFQAPVNTNKLPSIPLFANGGDGNYHWYINGQYHHSSKPLITSYFTPTAKGEYQVVVSDALGNTDKVHITIQ